MKPLLQLLLLLLCVPVFGQQITGDWNGLLNVGQELPIVLHIEKTEGGYSGTLDSPAQKAFGMEMSTISFKKDSLTFSIARIGMSYAGVLSNGEISGVFQQGGIQMPLGFSRGAAKAATQNRPQEPKKPYPYKEEEVVFTNTKGGHTLAGTLTLPKSIMPGKKKYPAVILITGSGAQDRNEALLGHKPFLVLSDYLTRQGIAVLRYDDRGTGQSTGVFEGATSYDFSYDAEAAFTFLRQHPEINPDQIGFAGHSEGGYIAPMIAARNKDVAFIALLAGVGQPGDELLVSQGYLIGKAQGLDESMLQSNKLAQQNVFAIIKTHYGDTPRIEKEVEAYLRTMFEKNPDVLPEGSSIEELLDQQLSSVKGDWFQYLITTPAAPFLEKVACPVLAINGSLDLQVPAQENLQAIATALKKGGNTDVTTVELPQLNHLFQHAETGNPSEYAIIEETFAPIALQTIGDWIKKKTTK